MIKRTIIYILCLFRFLVPGQNDLLGQNQQKKDSLYKIVSSTSGVEKAKALNKLTEMLLRSAPDSSFQYSTESIAILRKIKNTNEAKKELARAITFNSILYSDKADFEMALKGLLEALKLNEETGEKKQIANSLNSIGRVYYGLRDTELAMKYWQDALALRLELGDKKDIAISLCNIGVLYIDKPDKIDSAMYYYNKSLALYNELNDLRGKAMCYNNMAIYYQKKKLYSKALEYYFLCLPITEKLKDQMGNANTLNNIGQVYTAKGDYTNAIRYLENGAKLSKSIGAKQLMSACYRTLVETHIHLNNPVKAISILDELLAVNDSMYNSDNSKNIAEMQTKYETAKKDKELIKKDIEITKQQADAKQKAIQRNAFITGFTLVLLFAFFIFRSYRQKQKANIEIIRQKEIIQEKNKEITDSIQYAKRLQNAILPPLNFVKKLFPESFILFKPKDIVAGDFYWMEVIEETTYIAAADCTGHGVPGAMVSVVCSNALNRTVKEFSIKEPGKILDKVRDLVIETFEKSESEVKDGMDISLCSIKKAKDKKNTMNWSGANNPLWIIRDNKLLEYKPNKQPIGKTENPTPFTSNTIELQNNDVIYLFTDGYADQFGGDKGKKFKYKQLQELLIEINSKSMQEQEYSLSHKIEEWKGKLEQVDDILIIGIKIKSC